MGELGTIEISESEYYTNERVFLNI